MVRKLRFVTRNLGFCLEINYSYSNVLDFEIVSKNDQLICVVRLLLVATLVLINETEKGSTTRNKD